MKLNHFIFVICLLIFIASCSQRLFGLNLSALNQLKINWPLFHPSPSPLQIELTPPCESSSQLPCQPSPSPSPKPLTFAEMQALYGPCVSLPTLLYHHVQDAETATANNQKSLTVFTDVFQSHLQYLKDKGYQPVSIEILINFFTNGTLPPPKSVLLTFDDAYADFGTVAFPILQAFGFPATVFVSTGLVDNPGYLDWSQISSMSSQIFFANHTWSHRSVASNQEILEKEISTADSQLTLHNLNSPKVFAYPYGITDPLVEKYLAEQNYQLAFTTVPGRILCTKKRFDLPRIRIGNGSLASYGL